MEEREREKSKYIPMYYSYVEQLGLLSLEQVGALMMALLTNGRDGSEPNFAKDSNLYMAYSFISEEAKRAEIRGLDILEKKRRGGQARAATAQKDERGRFLPNSPAQTQHGSSTSSTPSTSRYSNSNGNGNSNSNGNDNRRYTRACARDDDVDDSQREILSYCREVVGSMSKSQEKKILDAAEGMAFDDVINAISVAWDYDAKTPEFIANTIRTQKEKPERCPGKIW